jgi:hypothetical protein
MIDPNMPDNQLENNIFYKSLRARFLQKFGSFSCGINCKEQHTEILMGFQRAKPFGRRRPSPWPLLQEPVAF